MDIGQIIMVGGVAYLLYSNRGAIVSLMKKRPAVLTGTVERTAPDIHDAVDAVRVLQSFLPPETAAEIAKTAGATIFTVGGPNDAEG